jgi:hypothetical protein
LALKVLYYNKEIRKETMSMVNTEIHSETSGTTSETLPEMHKCRLL